MKNLRNIKITLSYFLILIVFSQCTKKIGVYQYPDKLILTDLRLFLGDIVKVTVQSGKTMTFEFSHLEGDYIVGSKGAKNTLVKINSKDIIKVDLIHKYSENPTTYIYAVFGVAVVVFVVGAVIAISQFEYY